MRYIQANISSELFFKLKMYCVRTSSSITYIITSAITEYLNNRENEFNTDLISINAKGIKQKEI
jgi:hypothetical protein